MSSAQITDHADIPWSNLTIREIENHINSLIIRMPVLQQRISVRYAYGKEHGADIEISLVGADEQKHYLLFEIEQYASGVGLGRKVVIWSKRHAAQPNTHTVIVSLILPALHNRLTKEFSQDEEIRKFVFSSEFRLFPGNGDGSVSPEIKSFVTHWIEHRL